MAILVTPVNSSTAKIIERPDTEYDFYGLGSERSRTLYNVTLEWPCDATGAVGSTIPTSYTNSDSVVCAYQGGEPRLGRNGLNGTFVARYLGKGSWVY